MIKKQTFGAFVREKRLEKKMTQKELAELLFVSESAVSKWEMGKSYPDITLIPDICRVLEVSERELIAGATDTEYRIMKKEAKWFRMISGAWFWTFTIGYAVALVICLICDLAANHGLTFSPIVFASLILAYSFVPTWTRFSNDHKLAVFMGTSYLSLMFLFAVCCLRYHQGWLGIAGAAVLLGYAVCFGPSLIRRYIDDRYRRLSVPVYFGFVYLCLVFLLLVIRVSVKYDLWRGILISLYSYIPFAVISVMHMLKMNNYYKAAVDILSFGIIAYGVQWWIGWQYNGDISKYYRVDFTDWINCASGNISILVLLALIIVSIVIAIAGKYSDKKNRSTL